MRARLIGVLTAAVAGTLLTACGTQATSAPPTTGPVTVGLSATTGPLPSHGGTPLDVGRVRLWTPAGWSLEVDACAPTAPTMGCTSSPCPPGSPDTVTVATFTAPPTACHGVARGAGSVWVYSRRIGAGRPTSRRLRDGHGSVIVEVPALGVTLFGFSPMGARIAESFGPSPLASLLAARLPVAPPSGWRHLSYGLLAVEVPASWPHHDLEGSHRMADPGSCGFTDFLSPSADVGRSDVLLFCPMIDATSQLEANAHPSDGVWLQPPGPVSGAGVDSPTTTIVRRVHGLRLELEVPSRLTGSDAIVVVVRHDGRTGTLLLGLGRSPVIAEQLLSSIELAR